MEENQDLAGIDLYVGKLRGEAMTPKYCVELGKNVLLTNGDLVLSR